jgi:hypothetical protein
VTNSPAEGPRTSSTALRASLAVVLLLATFGGFGAGFGVLTGCTNDYGCTVTACAPCATANDWLTAGWIAQGVLLLVGVASAVSTARSAWPRAVRVAALGLGPVSIGLFVVTTAMAVSSY